MGERRHWGDWKLGDYGGGASSPFIGPRGDLGWWAMKNDWAGAIDDVDFDLGRGSVMVGPVEGGNGYSCSLKTATVVSKLYVFRNERHKARGH
jgi:hypothetical protein